MLSDAVNCHDIDKTICASRETVFFSFLVSFMFFCYMWKLSMYFYSFERHGFCNAYSQKCDQLLIYDVSAPEQVFINISPF